MVLSGLTCAAADAEESAKPVANPAPILADLQQKMSSVNTVYLEFTQERHYEMLSNTPTSHGVMLIQRPDQIRWETTDPNQTLMLGNRKSVAQFEFANGKWKKLEVGFSQMLRRVMDQMSLMNQGKLDALTGDYDISVSTNASAIILTMVPKDEDVRSMLPSLEVRLLPDLSATHEVVMNEGGGNFTRIIFTREVRDATFPQGTFDQAKPADITAVKAAVAHGK
jgi:outer membrane lipoprotein-sorting protein